MTDEPPLYDPAVHDTDTDPVVRLAMYCACGGVFAQVDPVSHCLPQIADFREKHSGKGHGAASPKVALAEREARREAGFRAAGRQAEYKPKRRSASDGPGFDWTKKDKS